MQYSVVESLWHIRVHFRFDFFHTLSSLPFTVCLQRRWKENRIEFLNPDPGSESDRLTKRFYDGVHVLARGSCLGRLKTKAEERPAAFTLLPSPLKNHLILISWRKKWTQNKGLMYTYIFIFSKDMFFYCYLNKYFGQKAEWHRSFFCFDIVEFLRSTK